MSYSDEVFKMIEDTYEKTGLITETFTDKNLDAANAGKDILIKFEIGNSENLTKEKAILASIAYLRIKMKQPLAVIEFVAFGKDENKEEWRKYIQTMMHLLSPDDISYVSPFVDERFYLLHQRAITNNANLMRGLYER